MYRQNRTQRPQNQSGSRLSTMIETHYLKAYKSKQLKWPVRLNGSTNKVQKSRRYKSTRTLVENDYGPERHEDRKYLQVQASEKPSETTDLLQPVEFSSDNNKMELIPRTKSKKKIDVTNKVKSLKYCRNNNENNVYDYIQGAINKVFSNNDGCECPKHCSLGRYIVEWSKSYKPNSTVYTKFKSIEPNQQNKIQIQKDIQRTQPYVGSFKTPKYLSMLKSLLTVYSVYDRQVGYVQGLNILVAGLLFHIKNQEDSFWVLCKLMYDCEVRILFLNDFKEVYRHLAILQKEVSEWINDLYLHLLKNDVHIQQFCFSWILTLMSILVDVNNVIEVLGRFAKQKWVYLYKLVIAYLLYLKESLMLEDDISGLLTILSVSHAQNKTNWKEVISLANTLPLNKV